MAFDSRRVPPGKLCQLLNSTPAGPVLTAARLRRHREQAGFTICAPVLREGLPPLPPDGKTVDFLKYAAWLILRRHARPTPGASEAGAAPTRKLGPSFDGAGPRFGG